MKINDYFLGSNSKNGFVSYFNKILLPEKDRRLYIIKGGPGSGKSTLMKKLLAKFTEEGDDIEKFYCSSDPNSLDGVLSVNKKIGIIDGTAPHLVEPSIPGAFEIILNTGEGFKTDILKENFYNISALQTKINAHHKRAQGFIKAASILREQSFIKAEQYLNYDVVYTMAEMLPYLRFLKEKGEAFTRLLSAVSVEKVVFFGKNLESKQLVYGILDRFGPASHYLIKRVKKIADEKGFKHTICPCSINPERLEHIIFNNDVAFTTLNDFHRFYGTNTQTLEGFYLPMPQNLIRELEIETAQSHAIINMAAKEIMKAKSLHDELEKIYISAMDFSVIDALYEKIKKDLEKRQTP